MSSAAFAAGVILGGVLTASLGWRSIFFINVPIGIIAALLTPRFLAESRGQGGNRHLDILGAATVTIGLSLLVYALTQAANSSLLSFGTLSLLGLSAVVLVSFLLIESRSKSPLMPLSFLRRRTVFIANAIALITVSCMSGLIFLLTIYLQQLRNYSALSAGIAFLPVALIFLVVGGFLSARFVARFGMKTVLVGSMMALAAGFVLLSRITVGTSYFLDLLPSMLVAAFGAALAFTAFNIAGLSGAKQGEEGLASGLVNTSTQVGGPIGLAIAVTIATTAAAALASQLQPIAATVSGFGYAFLGEAVLAGIGLVFALTLTRPKATQKAVLEAPQAAAETKEAMEIRKIMVAVDGSDNGYRAAETAIKLAKDYHAELIVLRVVTVPTALTPAGNRAGGSVILKEFYDYAEKDAKDYVDRLANEAKSAGVPIAKGEIIRAESSPASAITGKAKNERVDLIVIGSRGLDRPKRLLLGSVSSGVVADSSSQVLVVK